MAHKSLDTFYRIGRHGRCGAANSLAAFFLYLWISYLFAKEQRPGTQAGIVCTHAMRAGLRNALAKIEAAFYQEGLCLYD